MRRAAVIFLMLSLALLSGCNARWKLEKTMVEFTSHELTLPEHLLKIENGTIEDCSWPDSVMVFVKYYGPDECSSCAVIHLYEDEIATVDYCDSVGVVPMVVFTSSGGDVSELVYELKISNISFPVYIDVDDVFAESSEIPKDKLFHHFLLGKDGHPVFVGNPVASKQLEELFLAACREHWPAEL